MNRKVLLGDIDNSVDFCQMCRYGQQIFLVSLTGLTVHRSDADSSYIMFILLVINAVTYSTYQEVRMTRVQEPCTISRALLKKITLLFFLG